MTRRARRPQADEPRPQTPEEQELGLGQPVAAHPTTWLAVVQEIRTRASQELWRLSVADDLEWWRPFIVYWLQAAAVLARTPVALTYHDSPEDFDVKLAWSWEQVDEMIPYILQAIDLRSPISSAMIEHTFSALQASALIFPDGGVHPALMEQLQAEQVTKQMKVRRNQNTISIEAVESGRQLNAARAAIETALAQAKATK